MSEKRPFCLTIAGFDPSGGAGILADIKTFEQFKIQGIAVQTANTVQTGSIFQSCIWTPKEIIIQQLELLLSEYRVRYLKIGLIENDEILLEILRIIRTKAPKALIIWDPVLSASAGGSWDEKRFQSGLSEIMALLDIVTPNLPEYSKLFGDESPEKIAEKYGKSIYLKGGHSELSKGKDVFYTSGKIYPINPKQKVVSDKHGTGCVLSAALTASFSQGYPVTKALLKTKRYVEYVMKSNSSKLGYHER